MKGALGMLFMFFLFIMFFVGMYYYGKITTEQECKQIVSNKEEVKGVIKRKSRRGRGKSNLIFSKFNVNGKEYENILIFKRDYGDWSGYKEGDSILIYYSQENPDYSQYIQEFERKCE